MLLVFSLIATGLAAHPHFEESRVCEWPTSAGHGTWTGDVISAAGNTTEHVRASCSAVLVHERVLITAAHCLDPGFESGVFGEVVRFGNHIEDDEARAERLIESCEAHPAGYELDDGRYGGPDVAVCILTEPAPHASTTPIMVPASCETDYIRYQAFEESSAHLNTAYPNSPFGFGMAPLAGTAVGYGLESRESAFADEPCSLVYEDCETGNRRAVPSYIFHEKYFTLGIAENPDVVAARVVPFLYRRHDTSYSHLPRWHPGEWPDSTETSAILDHGDSGGPLYFEMEDGSWRVIGIASSKNHQMLVSEWDTIGSFEQQSEAYYKFASYASLPVYLPWVESVVDDALGVDLTPCHALESIGGEPRYTYEWTPACADAVSHYATTPDSYPGIWNNGCTNSEGGDDFWLTRECAGWDGSSSLAPTPAPTQGELLLGLAAAAEPPQSATLFELPPTWEVFGSTGIDRFEVHLTERHTSFLLGDAGDWLVATGTSTDQEVEVLAGAGDDMIDLTASTDMVFPGPGLDDVSTGDGDDTVVILGACELEVGEVLDGGKGEDLLIAPTDACDLATRGVYALNFEKVEITSPRAEEQICGRVGGLPPVTSAPDREQLALIEQICETTRR